MKVSREEARRIALLAHLEFDEEGLDRIAAEMTSILTYVDQLVEADTGESEAADTNASTPLRDDVPHQPLDRDEVGRNAPSWSDVFFVVPKVIGDGS